MVNLQRPHKYTPRSTQKIYYSDFKTNFDLNPLTGFLELITNEQAVISSIRNLVLTNKGERHFQPEVGSNIQNGLFEMIDEVQSETLRISILNTIRNYEPRAINPSVEVTPDIQNEAYMININFQLINIPNQVFSAPIILKRIR